MECSNRIGPVIAKPDPAIGDPVVETDILAASSDRPFVEEVVDDSNAVGVINLMDSAVGLLGCVIWRMAFKTEVSDLRLGLV